MWRCVAGRVVLDVWKDFAPLILRATQSKSPELQTQRHSVTILNNTAVSTPHQARFNLLHTFSPSNLNKLRNKMMNYVDYNTITNIYFSGRTQENPQNLFWA